MKTKIYKKYDFIFNEGTYGDSAYMIDFGKVGIISATNQDDKRKLLATLKKNDIFLEHLGEINNSGIEFIAYTKFSEIMKTK